MSQLLYRTLLIVLLLTTLFSAQGIIGLWEIKNVTVGEESMTPIAKWTNIKPDGTYTSGNGWLQNSQGTWNYDEDKKELTNTETIGLIDEFGAFNVSFADDNMIWERVEEGMNVTVILQKIETIPQAPADMSQGLWDLVSVNDGEGDLTNSFDPENKYYIFIRWDRIYVERTPEGNRETGYWHMHGHRPEITLLPHNPDKQPESWRVENSMSKLVLTGISDSNKGKVYKFKRLNQFPE